MLLGDVIARLEDESFADDTLIGLGDLALAVRIGEAAAREGLTRGEFVAAAVGRFAATCADEQWVTVIGQMGRTNVPGQVLLSHAVTAALSDSSAETDLSPANSSRNG